MGKLVNSILEGLNSRNHRRYSDYEAVPFSVEDVPSLDASEKEVHDDIVKVFSTKYKNISDKYGLSSVVVDLENGYDESRNLESVVTLFYIYFYFSKLDEKDKKGVSEVLSILSKYNKKSDIDVYMDNGKCVFIVGAEAQKNPYYRNSYKDFDKLGDFLDAISNDFKIVADRYESYEKDDVISMYYGDW